MFVNTGKNLFLPEGDDYSKAEFDHDAEEVEATGNELLNKLRDQQQLEKKIKEVQQAELLRSKSKMSENQPQNGEEKLSFGDLLQSVVGRRK